MILKIGSVVIYSQGRLKTKGTHENSKARGTREPGEVSRVFWWDREREIEREINRDK